MAKPLTPESIELFRKAHKETKISPVLIHANYLINLSAADEIILLKSIESSLRDALNWSHSPTSLPIAMCACW